MYLSSVEFNGETARISDSFRASTFMDDGGESDDDRSLNSGSTQKISTCEMRDVMSDLEEALRTGSSRVDYTLRDSFTVKIR